MSRLLIQQYFTIETGQTSVHLYQTNRLIDLVSYMGTAQLPKEKHSQPICLMNIVVPDCIINILYIASPDQSTQRNKGYTDKMVDFKQNLYPPTQLRRIDCFHIFSANVVDVR
jgi:hypothetical protein